MWIAIQNAVGARQGVGGGPGPTPPPYTPPLDAYTNTVVAYSVRKLSSSYSGPCMQVRRASDSTTLDIGFDSNGLVKTADIAAFCAGSVGTVSIWYDQGSLGQNATQSDTTKEPSIYDGIDFYYIDGQVCVRAAGSGIGFNHTVSHTGDWTTLTVISADNPGSGSTGWTYGNGGGAGLGSVNGDTVSVNLYYGAIDTISGESTFQTLFSVFIDSVGVDWFRNAIGNTGVGSGLSGFSFDHFMSRRVSDVSSIRMQEWIMWDSDLIAAQSTLETNLNEYYQVTNLPYYTSGFLADYSGAAAAYSVRKLSNTAIKALRVRRTVPPFDEQDIGFTPAGDLDTAAITTFGGADTLVVSRWYDQSGFSRHAVQISPGFQPQIYNGTSVVTKNGNPALAFGGTHFVAQIDVINQPSTYVSVHDIVTNSGYTYPWSAGNTLQEFTSFGLTQSIAIAGSYLNGPNIDDYMVSSVVFNGTSSIVRTNGTVGITGNTGTSSTGTSLGIGARFTGSNQLVSGSIMQELIVWPTNQTSPTNNLPAIETNINDYYYAYNTSGFVVDYPGAIAAYSVRQLGNRQRYAMRVRRLGGAADYLDVGFVAGELDTQAIIDFGGSDTLGVEVWYDQSRSGNDVTNTSTTTMPIIYNGSSVITDGGKPALGRNSAGLYMPIPTGNIIPAGVTQASFIAVTQGPDAGTLVRTWYGSGGGSLNSLTTGNNLYVYNGGSTQFGSGPAVGRTLGIQLTDSNPGAAEKGWRNGVLNYSGDSGPNTPRTSFLGSNALSSSPLFMQEMILYPSDIDAGGTRTNIELNIMTYYGIP